jgi:hypothetical protein
MVGVKKRETGYDTAAKEDQRFSRLGVLLAHWPVIIASDFQDCWRQN